MNRMCQEFAIGANNVSDFIKDEVFPAGIINKLNEGRSTDEVVKVLESAIVDREIAEAMFISIYSDRESVLNLRHVMLPEEYSGYSFVYKHYFFKNDENDPVPECFTHNKVIYVDSENTCNYMDTTQTRFSRLKIREMVNIPLVFEKNENGKLSLEKFGVLTLYNTSELLNRDKINSLIESMTPILTPLYFACEREQLLANEEYVKSSLNYQERSMYLSKQVFSMTSPEEIYKLIAKDILELYPYSLSTIIMQDDKDRLLKVMETAIADEKYSNHKKIYDAYFRSFAQKPDATEGASAACFVLGIPFDFDDVKIMSLDKMSATDKEGLRLLPYSSTLHIPIKNKGMPIGVLTLIAFDERVILNNKDMEQISMLCEFFGAAIDSAKMHEKADRQAREIIELNKQLEENVSKLEISNQYDGKTGLKNFDSFRETILQRFSEEKRYKENLSVLMIDIDKFKRLNDKYGHIIADQALVYVANKISDHTRAMDLPAFRFGGEEMVVLLPKCNLEESRVVAERIRKSICETLFSADIDKKIEKYKDLDPNIKITVSIGCAQKNKSDNPDTLLARADAAMYSAKEAGRNKVEVAK